MSLTVTTLTIILPLVFILLGLTFAVAVDPYIQPKNRRIMLLIIVLCALMIAQNYLENELAFSLPRPRMRTIIAIYGYAVRPVMLVLFLYLVQPGKKQWFWWILVDLNAAVYATALFTNIAFEITEKNHYSGGPLANTVFVISAVLLINLLVQSIRSQKGKEKREYCIPILVVLMIVAGVIMDMEVSWESQPVTFLTIAVVTGTVFYCFWLHLQFVREKENPQLRR